MSDKVLMTVSKETQSGESLNVIGVRPKREKIA